MKIQPLVSVGYLLFSLTASVAAQVKIDFSKEKAGSLPGGFTTALTGQGKAGVWVVTADGASPNQGNVPAQTDADATSYRFPVCVYDKLTAKNV